MTARAGMTLVEIMVALAIIGIVSAVAIPSLSGVFDVQQRASARDIARLYQFMLSEAALRDVTFRVAYDLDGGSWKVEVGDPDTLVFGTPEEMKEWEEEQLKKTVSRFKKTDPAEADADNPRFADLSYPGLDSDGQLPDNCMFAWVYTPQYGEAQRPSDPPPEEGSPHRIVYSYVFPDGTAEYTMVRIVDSSDEEDGYTVEIEPLSGEARVDADVLDPLQAMSWLPTEGPAIR